MKLDELRIEVDKRKEAGRDYIILVVGKRNNPGHRIRLLQYGGPVGDFCCVNSNGDCVGSFKIVAIERFLKRLSK